MTNKHKKDQAIMLALSVIDLVTGILSIVFSILAIQCIATIASGATLAKAVSIIVNGEKAAKLGKNGGKVGKLIVKKLPAVASVAAKIIVKGVIKMRFVDKLKECIKNNPRTIGAIILETVFGGVSGFGVYEAMQKYCVVLVSPWNVIVPIAATIIAYALVVLLTVKAGYENINEATVRKTADAIGVSEVADMLISIKAQHDAEEERKKKNEQEIAERKAAEDKIIAAYEEEERQKLQAAMELEEKRAEERERAEREAKIAAYKKAHPEMFTDGNKEE